MADSPLQKNLDSSRNWLWKWLLLTLCIASALGLFAFTINVFALGGHPWYGIWGVYNFPTGQPYVERFDPPQPGLAAARAGIRAGDWMDLRDQNLTVRIGMFAQPMAMQPIPLVVHRGARSFMTSLIPTTMWEDRTALLPFYVALIVWNLWFVGCAFLIAAQRATAPEARLLALTLLCFVGVVPSLVVPSATATAFFWVSFLVIFWVVAPLLMIVLSSRFGARSLWRRLLDSCAYAAVLLLAIELAAFVIGIVTLRIDPTKYGFAGLWNPLSTTTLILIIVGVGVSLVAAVAVATTGRSERPRAAWLLLPLPLATLVYGIYLVVGGFLHTWSAQIGLEVIANLCFVLCAFTVTYALLKRRVLDFEFVLSRTLVVATVSLAVVAAFVFLEWFLGSVVAGVSRITGFIANAALALVLGVSLRYIHRRVEAFVTSVIFRKRYDDERALRDFSKEAAYVTEASALLDQAIATIARHTDACSCALLLETNSAYILARSFGENISKEVDENDSAILAMKSWHKPLDPHHYQTALRGALAFPMLARGRLSGILLLGERRGGEAYAPDEVETFSQFAHGVGSALEALASDNRDPLAALRAAIASMQAAIIDELRAQQRPVDSQSF